MTWMQDLLPAKGLINLHYESDSDGYFIYGLPLKTQWKSLVNSAEDFIPLFMFESIHVPSLRQRFMSIEGDLYYQHSKTASQYVVKYTS